MKLVHRCFILGLFTASCDLVLTFNLGGTLRLCQILMIFVCIAAMAHAIQNARILWPRGGTALAIWLIGQMLCLPLSGNWGLGLEFFALLLFTCSGIFAVVQLYGLSDLIAPLMRLYMTSYVAVAFYGLFQFAMPIVGIEAPFTQQWFVHGKLARINGFNYEPSYYATYMIMGWIMLIDLRASKARIAAGAWWKWATIIVTASLFLSSSKTAWVFMIVELAARFAPRFWVKFRISLNTGKFLVRLPHKGLFWYAVSLLLFAAAGSYYIQKVQISPAIFLAGTGLANTPAHSLNDRQNAMAVSWEAFKESPFVGRSLGGVPVYLAARNGIQISTIGELRGFWGFPVLLDVLMASGLIGFIPFVVFLYAITRGAWKLAVRRWPEERARWLRALARAMIFEWLILLTDQNLLRVYLWFHITMVMVMAYHLEFAPPPVEEPVREPFLSHFTFEVPAAS